MLRVLSGAVIGWVVALPGRLFASETASPFDPASPVTWVSFGVAGVVTLAFAREWVVPGSALKRAEGRAELSESAVRDAAPALAASNLVQGQMLAYLSERERGVRGEGP